MASLINRFTLLRLIITMRDRMEKVSQFVSYYQRMLGDIYYWKPAEKALLISSTSLLINFIIECIVISLYLFKPASLTMSDLNLFWAMRIFAFNLCLLSLSCTLAYIFRRNEAPQFLLLVFSLMCLVVTMSFLTASVGFFDAVTWQLFFLFNATLIVFLDRRWVMTTFVCLLLFMIWMTFNANEVPFPIRAIRLAPQMSLSDVDDHTLIFEWLLLLVIGGSGIVMIDFFMSAWRNRDADLRSKSYIDELTQLLNRRALLERLEEEYRRAVRVGYPISVAMIDLDFFKKVNDNYGHPFGDLVLKAVAKEIASVGRKNDLMGRYGGEEFIVVFPECTAKVAVTILEKLRERVEALTLTAENGDEVSVTISAGIAQQESNDEEYLQLIARADFALYRAKEFGRNQVLSIEVEDNEQLAFLSNI